MHKNNRENKLFFFNVMLMYIAHKDNTLKLINKIQYNIYVYRKKYAV